MDDSRLKSLIPILKICEPNTFTSGETYRCPNCNDYVYPFYENNKKVETRYCQACGQAIDWKNQDKAKIELAIK